MGTPLLDALDRDGAHRQADLVTAPPELRGEKTLRLNFETTGLKWWDGDQPIGASYYFPESQRRGYVAWGHAGGNSCTEDTAREWLRSMRDSHIVNINTKFDLHMSEAFGVNLREQGNTFGDVAHYAALLDDHRIRFNLDQLAADMLMWDLNADGLGRIPLGISSEAQFRELDAAVVAPYAVRNIDQVEALHCHMWNDLEEQGLQRVRVLEESVLPAVVEMEANGTYLDMDLLHQWRQQAKKDLEQKLFEVFKQTGVRISSFDSSKDLARIFNVRKIPMTAQTDAGAPSFTDAVLAGIDDPVIRLVRDGGHLADLLSKYLDKYANTVRADGWLRFNLHQLRTTRGDSGDRGAGTVSGRFSSAGDAFGGFNCQQVVAVEKQLERGWCPSYVIRKLFKAIYGQWLAADMMQVEYRYFAHLAKSPEVLKAYRENPLTDYHKVVQGLLHRVNPNLNRKLTKNINFAKMYGAGLAKFAYMVGVITEEQYKKLYKQYDGRIPSRLPELQPAKAINDTYNEMFPEVKALLEQASNVARDRGYVKTLLGRRARFPVKFKLHSALNRIIQGSAGDWNKRVVAEVYKERKRLEFVMRLTVHDEVGGDLMNPDKLEAIKEVLNTQYYPLNVPILWDVRVANSWGEAK